MRLAFQPNIISNRCPPRARTVHVRNRALQPAGQKVDGRGKPYISVKRATRKALKAPNERQSRAVFGLKKLNAKIANTAVFRITSDHRP